jgi:hypothetical protein
MTPTKPVYSARPLSRVLEDIAGRPDPQLRLGELVNEFGERGFGALLFLLGLLSVLIGTIPGTTTVIGIPMLLIAFQLIMRRDELYLPGWALRHTIQRKTFADAAAKAIKPLRMVERVSRPRLGFMNTDLSEMLIGLACAFWALILMLPLIGFNLFPSLFVVAFGFGLTQRDGIIMLIGWLGSAIFGVVIWLAWEVVSRAVTASWEMATGFF